MTANQRRPGFRLPWSTEEEGSSPDGDAAATAQDVPHPEASATAAPEAADAQPEAADAQPEAADAQPEAAVAQPEKVEAAANTPAPAAADAAAPAKAPAEESAAQPESGDEFMRDLVAAMRAVAEEARHAGVTELKAKADVQVKTLEADAVRRRDELNRASDEDIAGIAKWAEAEADRIKQEAEQKTVARKARLDQELAADGTRTEAEAKAVRDRVAAYEAELEAYHAQLSQINDPAAFAAAAKRLPKPPALGGSAAAASTPSAAADPATPEVAPTEPAAEAPAAEAATNGVSADPASTNADVLASRLAELDATLPKAEPASTTPAPEPTAATEPEPAAAEQAADASASTDAPAPAAAEAPAAPAPPPAAPAPAAGEPAVTEVVVKGLGSFGAITGFRQSLSGVDGIESVALSLGQTGEFVFRATHAPGFDVKEAIAALEGDGAKIEARPEGGLRVTLERAR